MEIVWTPCRDGLPRVVESSIDGRCTIEKSEFVLVQTKDEKIFIAHFQRWRWADEKDEELDWYSYGTRGRKMKIMSKVIAWMPLPERYVEVCEGK